MTEIDETALHCSTLVGRMAHSLKLRFTRHEAWALKVAKKVPVMGFFTFGTLWVWFFLPMIPIGIFCVWLLENAGVIGAIASTVLGGWWIGDRRPMVLSMVLHLCGSDIWAQKDGVFVRGSSLKLVEMLARRVAFSLNSRLRTPVE
ncbi:MAG: hypothetical protein ABJY83_19145 [Roseibium sp.]